VPRGVCVYIPPTGNIEDTAVDAHAGPDTSPTAGPEACRFARGHYCDPAAVHGDDMPGLAELAEGGGDIRVVYQPADAGGRIAYMSSTPALVDAALHRWGEAQTSDHGDHAEQGWARLEAGAGVAAQSSQCSCQLSQSPMR
jgi:hypothetical protein